MKCLECGNYCEEGKECPYCKWLKENKNIKGE